MCCQTTTLGPSPFGEYGGDDARSTLAYTRLVGAGRDTGEGFVIPTDYSFDLVARTPTISCSPEPCGSIVSVTQLNVEFLPAVVIRAGDATTSSWFVVEFGNSSRLCVGSVDFDENLACVSPTDPMSTREGCATGGAITTKIYGTDDHVEAAEIDADFVWGHVTIAF